MVGWFEAKGIAVKFGLLAWLLLIAGAALIFLSFIEDYSRLLYEHGIFSGKIDYLEPGFIETITSYVPDKFNWLLFGAGEFLTIISIYIILSSSSKIQQKYKDKSHVNL